MTKPIPEGYHSITSIVVMKDARKAIDFYKKAFGAKEKLVMPGPKGNGVMHAEIIIGDSIIMLADENQPHQTKSAETLGGSPVSFFLYVKDVDNAFKKAVEAGSKSHMPVQDMFWGDRVGAVIDPFGHSWMIATHTKDLTDEEIKKGAAEAMYAQNAKK